ncbi:hypothetical protein R3P38DRAFT_3451451 [Favolaschia claudopus]|uniref:EthD domain-containing protein n=1 Tax=Favolaschia claudopus TaxID=2862362 RepID=A0AAV9ZKL9_9AGAR
MATFDVFYALGIHRAPASACIPEFERLMESIVDECVNLLPLVKQNYLKVDMIFQDENTPALEIGPRSPAVFVVIQALTPENVRKVLASPELRKIFQKGKDFGNQSSFFAYSKVLIDQIDPPAPDNGIQMVFVYDGPLDENHMREFDDFMRGFVLLPGIQESVARLEMWQSTNILDEDVQDFGYSTESQPMLYCATLKDSSVDAVKQMMSDPDTQRYFAEGRQQLDLKKYGYWFVANVVTKLD